MAVIYKQVAFDQCFLPFKNSLNDKADLID